MEHQLYGKLWCSVRFKFVAHDFDFVICPAGEYVAINYLATISQLRATIVTSSEKIWLLVTVTCL